MKNNLETQNQELLNEIETLKKQLTQKEESLKFRIWKTIYRIKENCESSISLEILRTIAWPEKGWVSSKSGGLESTNRYFERCDWDERVAEKYIAFSEEFTLENIIKSLNQELKRKEESQSMSVQGYQFLENQLKEEITNLKKNIEDLEKKMEEENIREMEEKLKESKEKNVALEIWEERFENKSADEVHSILKNLGLMNLLLIELREKEEQLKEMIISFSCENKLEGKEISLLKELFQEQEKISKSGEISVYERSKEITESLTKEKLTNEQVQTLLNKQREITNLEKKINFLQEQSFQTKIEVSPQNK
jgi:hypothetical protein